MSISLRKKSRAKKIVNKLDHSKHNIKTITRPYLLDENDPHKIVTDRGNTTKYLTINDKWRILALVNKLKRKDKKMAADKTKKAKGKKLNMLKSIIWLSFAVQQAFEAYVLLRNFDNYFVAAAALISLGIAGVVVVSHFISAHK